MKVKEIIYLLFTVFLIAPATKASDKEIWASGKIKDFKPNPEFVKLYKQVQSVDYSKIKHIKLRFLNHNLSPWVNFYHWQKAQEKSNPLGVEFSIFPYNRVSVELEKNPKKYDFATLLKNPKIAPFLYTDDVSDNKEERPGLYLDTGFVTTKDRSSFIGDLTSLKGKKISILQSLANVPYFINLSKQHGFTFKPVPNYEQAIEMLYAKRLDGVYGIKLSILGTLNKLIREGRLKSEDYDRLSKMNVQNTLRSGWFTKSSPCIKPEYYSLCYLKTDYYTISPDYEEFLVYETGPSVRDTTFYHSIITATRYHLKRVGKDSFGH